jgi:hypothetical protein
METSFDLSSNLESVKTIIVVVCGYFLPCSQVCMYVCILSIYLPSSLPTKSNYVAQDGLELKVLLP